MATLCDADGLHLDGNSKRQSRLMLGLIAVAALLIAQPGPAGLRKVVLVCPIPLGCLSPVWPLTASGFRNGIPTAFLQNRRFAAILAVCHTMLCET